MPDILVVGSLNADLVVRSPRLPQPGETISGEDLQIIPGGKGANQAVAAARQGASVSMLGGVGSDSFGPELINNLKQNHVDTSHVQVDSQAATLSHVPMGAPCAAVAAIRESIKGMGLPFASTSPIKVPHVDISPTPKGNR